MNTIKFLSMLKSSVFVSFLTIILIFWSCVEQRDLKSNNVVIRVDISPDGIHPTNSNSAVGAFVQSFLHQSLVATNPETNEDFPMLLKQLPQVDESGLVYRYELKDSVYWDNGQELSVEDIIFTVKVLLCPLTDNAAVRPIYSSVIEDVYPDKNLPKVFYLKCKNIHILNKDILGGVYLLQKQFWDKNGDLNDLKIKDVLQTEFKSLKKWDDWFNAFNSSDNAYLPEKLVGLGAYKLVKFEKDDYIKLVKKDNWWGEKMKNSMYDAYPKELIFKVIQDPTSAYLGVKNQKIDFTQSVGGISKLMKLQQLDYFNENYNSDFVPSYIYRYVGLNMKPDGIKNLPFFKDVDVRRAIALLVPVDEIIEVIYYGKATRQAGIVSPLNKDCDSSVIPLPYDIAKAKELLANAGWKDTDGDNILDKIINGKKVPFSFKLNYVSMGALKEIVLMIKDAMKNAGVDVIPNPMDFNSLYNNASSHTFDAMLGGWAGGSGYSDPTQLWSTESWANMGSNFCGFGDTYSDSLIVAANTSLTPQKHKEAYFTLQRYIYQQQPYVFLWSEMQPMAIHKRFKDQAFFSVRPNINIGSLQLRD